MTRNIRLCDFIAALGYAATCVFPMDQAGSFWIQSAALVFVALPLIFCGEYPIGVFALVLTSTTICLLLGAVADPFLAAAWALYPVAVRYGSPGRRGVVAGVCAIVLVLVVSPESALWVGAEEMIRFALLSTAALGGSWVLGQLVRALRLATERAKRAEAERAVTEERLRIARELHDVVSHSVSSIGVRAGVGAHLLETDPAGARQALVGIEHSCREAVVEMRHMLTTLRAPNGAATSEAWPDLSRLSDLIDEARRSGVECVVEVQNCTELPLSVQVSAYRIVQECLTNVIRHAGGARCQIRMIGDETGVEMDIVDTGTADVPSTWESGGHGIVGMRERASAHGGWLRAGPICGGGFRVRAHLGRGPVETA